jgi:hyaluronoglucosaminidase
VIKQKLISKAVISVCLVTAGLSIPFNIQSTTAKEDNGKYEFKIYPVPKSITKTGEGFPLSPKVALVTEKETDHPAIEEIKAALKKAGVKEIVESDIKNPVLSPSIVIWLGAFTDAAKLKTIRENVGVLNLDISKKEGYIVVSNQGKAEKKHIVISGKDRSGTYYGTKTFEQMIIERQGTDWIPEVNINDWPTMPIRGAIEGFYGKPWSQQDRLSQLNFYGAHKMNSYIYAPKDDPYHRNKWREPYRRVKIKEIAQLVQTSKKNHVTFTFAISPGNTVTFSSNEDLQALINKAQAAWDVGVRSFALFLDDIDPRLHSPEDQEMFGKDANPSAAAQAHLLNRFNEQFIKTHPGADRLITVPTEYYQANQSPYRERFAELVQSDIIVQWTGIGVVAPSIKTADADQIHGIFKHNLLIWDNYPVNDFDRNRLFLGPFAGRDTGLTVIHGVIGLTANPMNEAEASKIPLFTVADFTWNPEAYNPNNSLDQSIKEIAGNASDALKFFIDCSYSTRLNGNKEPYSEKLKPLMKAFWSTYEGQDGQAAADKLLHEFIKLKNTPSQLRKTLDNQELLKEIKPYLNKMELYGIAGEAAVKMVLAQQEDNSQTAVEQRALLNDTVKKIRGIRQKLSLGVMPAFLKRAINGVN